MPLLASTALLALVLASTGAQAHAGEALAFQAREGDACLADPVCLELAGFPPDLAPGHDTAFELQVHPDASTSYEAALAAAPDADPDHEATPRSAAIAVVGPVEPGETASLNLTLPEADAVYVWLPGDDHEARGGWETVPIRDEQAGEPTTSRQAPAPGALVLASIASLLTVGHRRP